MKRNVLVDLEGNALHKRPLLDLPRTPGSAPEAPRRLSGGGSPPRTPR